jgi:hypothetical protein
MNNDIGYFEPDEVVKSIYKLIESRKDGKAYKCINGLLIIVSGEIHNNKKWLHVSFSRRSRIPEYRDIQQVKRDFIGDNKKAIMVFPEKKNYVNISRNCLHLFSCLDGEVLPEFSRNGLL